MLVGRRRVAGNTGVLKNHCLIYPPPGAYHDELHSGDEGDDVVECATRADEEEGKRRILVREGKQGSPRMRVAGE